MPYLGKSPPVISSSLEDGDSDTKIQVEESADEDVIRFDIAGAEDFTMAANNFSVLSGSTLTIDSGATIANSGTATGFPAPGKNLLINGGMTVAQRPAQTSVGAADGDRCAVDMWKVSKRGSPEGEMTSTKESDATMNLNGHEYICQLDCTTAEGAVASTEAHTLSQAIEGLNLQGLKYGTANAEAVTLSFWFSSPKTGIHCASLYLSDTGYSQVKEFTISSANTWEYFSLTFSANTSNKINNDTGSGMIVSFPLTAGSNFQVSADTWASGEDFATSNQQNLLDSTSNNVSLAGVQLEIGSVPTSFSYEDYGTTLTKCMRYLQVLLKGTQEPSYHCIQTSTVAGEQAFTYPVEMRAIPTSSVSDVTHLGVQPGGPGQNPSVVAFESGYTTTRRMWSAFAWASGAGTAYNMMRVYSDNVSCLWLMIAEL